MSREQELANEVERITLENAELRKQLARLEARLRDQPNPEQRITRAMVRGMRDDVRILREQIDRIYEEMVHNESEEGTEGAGPAGSGY